MWIENRTSIRTDTALMCNDKTRFLEEQTDCGKVSMGCSRMVAVGTQLSEMVSRKRVCEYVVSEQHSAKRTSLTEM